MRFMILMYPGDPRAEEGGLPDAKEIEPMMKFNDALARAGVLLALDGFHSSSKGARVGFAGGRPNVTEGPFVGTQAIVGGYWLWKVKSLAEAIDWAKKIPAAEGDLVEIRQVVEPEEFGPDVAAKEKKTMKRIGQRMAKRKPAGARR